MNVPVSALPQPLTVKHVFKLCDHHRLAELHNMVYTRIPYDEPLTVDAMLDHHREYQHAMALMQALASAPDITTGLILDMEIVGREHIVELPSLDLLANTSLTWDKEDSQFHNITDIGIAILSLLMYRYKRK